MKRRRSGGILSETKKPESRGAALPEGAVVISNAIRLFLISFILLYFQVLCIRWIPAYIRYLSFFSNVILLGAFLGMGIGCLCARRKTNFVLAFPPLLLTFMFLVDRFKFEMKIDTSQALYFTSEVGRLPFQTTVESFFLLPFVFAFVMLLFICLGQPFGRLLSEFSPLAGYTLSILGNLAGIAMFALNSFLRLPPGFWYSVLSIAFVLWLFVSQKRRHLIYGSVAMVIVTIWARVMAGDALWSPYYKITIMAPVEMPGTLILNVNNIGHQFIADYRTNPGGGLYTKPYELTGRKFSEVLVIGAGAGLDTARALAEGAERVDAVEIDPEIAELGKLLYPNQPYSNPGVHLHIMDGRNYFKNAQRKYDLIIYALTDSLTLTSSLSSLRLESYLFTLEAFREAKSLLKSNGVLALYNWYREPWLIAKIAMMLEEVFPGKVFVQADPAHQTAVLLAGDGVTSVNPASQRPVRTDTKIAPATDDWPFLYLPHPSLPVIYIEALLAMLIISGIAFLTFVPPGARTRIESHFFFLGAAFLLLETQSIIKFSLIFGSTWLVNALVFFAILVMVLFANWIVSRIEIRKPMLPFAVLFVILGVNYFVPVGVLARGGAPFRYGLASVFLLSPVFIANLLFSSFFKKSDQPEISLASNLLGALVGGMCEYLSLLFGYRALTLLVAVFYGLALLRPSFGLRHPPHP
ncbi:MAG: spermine/spermidine synthase domain-containing protein [bacterium JZ-2024 1]